MQEFYHTGLPHKEMIDLIGRNFGCDNKWLIIGHKMQDWLGRLYNRLCAGNGQPMDKPADGCGKAEALQLLFQPAAICAQPELLRVQVAQG